MSIMAFHRDRNVLSLQAFDAAYLDRLRLGDVETERNFVVYFSRLILLKVRSRVRSAQLAEDIRQETLLRAFSAVRAEGGIRSPEGLGAFVNSVCNHVLQECLRSQRRDFGAARGEGKAHLEESIDPEQAVLQQERSRQVRRVLDTLSARDQALLRAVFLEERDKDEVCRHFGVSRDYLRVLLYRAKTQFRDVYARQGEAAWPRNGQPQGR